MNSENEKNTLLKKIIIDNKVKSPYDLMRFTKQDLELEHYYLSNRNILDNMIIEYVATGYIN